MKSLYIAEKPSVAAEFAKALKISGQRRDGYLESEESVVTWCVGHLVTMSYPEVYDIKYKKWSFDTLPFLPAEFRYENGQTVIPIKLDYQNIGLFAFEKVDEEAASIVDTNAYRAYTTDEGMFIRAIDSGNFTATLCDGTEETFNLKVPAAYDIKEGLERTIEILKSLD